MRLPPAVRVLAAEEVGPDFHARFRAAAKTYRYRIWNGDVLSPFERAVRVARAGPLLDVAAMDDGRGAASSGRTTSRRFRATGSDARDARCGRIFSSSVAAAATTGRASRSSPTKCAATGSSATWCAAIVGTLVEVGRGRQPAAWMSEVLASRERGRAGRTAPATGLFLVAGRVPSSATYNGPACRLSSSWRGFRQDRRTKRSRGRSTSSSCPRTSPSSWTATAAGRHSAICRASKATAPASTRCATWSRRPRGWASAC